MIINTIQFKSDIQKWIESALFQTLSTKVENTTQTGILPIRLEVSKKDVNKIYASSLFGDVIEKATSHKPIEEYKKIL